jgi:hypothetical protein
VKEHMLHLKRTFTFLLPEQISLPFEVVLSCLLLLIFKTNCMTLQQFTKATYYVQRTMIEIHGIYLLSMTVGNQERKLYDVDGFYVELSMMAPFTKINFIRCFTVEEIDIYLLSVDISPLTELIK